MPPLFVSGGPDWSAETYSRFESPELRSANFDRRSVSVGSLRSKRLPALEFTHETQDSCLEPEPSQPS